MRIVIDLQGAQSESRYRGIGRYSLDLAVAIAKNRGSHEVIIALNDMFPDTISDLRAAFQGILPHSAIRVWTAVGPVNANNQNNTQRRIQAELIRETFLMTLEPDVVLVTSLFEGWVDDSVTSIDRISSIPTAVVLYDLIPLIRADKYLSDPNYSNSYLEKVGHLKMADQLLSISTSAGQEAIEHLSWDPGRVTNISAASNPIFRPLNLSAQDKTNLCQLYGIKRKMVMFTGTIEERKNIEGLIKAFAGLDSDTRNSYQLVVVCKAQDEAMRKLAKLAQSLGLERDSLIFTGYVSDEDLVAIYNICEVLVFPSFHEGFGLPALESMHCGKAVIASNTSSLPEVVGRSDVLFDPSNVADITAKLHKVLTDTEFRQDLELHGLEQAKKFGWDLTARKAIDELVQLHQRKIRQFESARETELDQLTARLAQDAMSESDMIQLANALSVTFPNSTEKPRIFVDVSELAQRDARTGIQRVVRSILTGLFAKTNGSFDVLPVRRNDEGRYVIASEVAQKLFGVDLGLKTEQPLATNLGDVFLGLDLELLCPPFACTEIEKMRRIGTKVFTIVYDLLPVQMPSFFPKEVGSAFPVWLERLSGYDGAICISRAVADDLSDWVSKNTKRKTPFQIGWFHLGADVENSVPSKGLPSDAESALDLLQQDPSFLMVGTLEPRKGHRQVLAAFDLLWARGQTVNLVIVGKEGWGTDDLVKQIRLHPQLGKRLFWQNGISDEYLEQIYAASTCLIAASEGEGFGLPLIEAAQHKIPILARDLPVFQEVAGSFARYFSGLSPDDLVIAIEGWMQDWKSGRHPKSDDMPKQTWAQSSKQLYDVIDGWLREDEANSCVAQDRNP